MKGKFILLVASVAMPQVYNNFADALHAKYSVVMTEGVHMDDVEITEAPCTYCALETTHNKQILMRA